MAIAFTFGFLTGIGFLTVLAIINSIGKREKR